MQNDIYTKKMGGMGGIWVKWGAHHLWWWARHKRSWCGNWLQHTEHSQSESSHAESADVKSRADMESSITACDLSPFTFLRVRLRHTRHTRHTRLGHTRTTTTPRHHHQQRRRRRLRHIDDATSTTSPRDGFGLAAITRTGPNNASGVVWDLGTFLASTHPWRRATLARRRSFPASTHPLRRRRQHTPTTATTNTSTPHTASTRQNGLKTRRMATMTANAGRWRPLQANTG